MILRNPSSSHSRKELMKIPGVGDKIALYFWDLGIKSISDLRGKNQGLTPKLS